MVAAEKIFTETSQNELRSAYDRMHGAVKRHPNPRYEERVEHLQRLLRALMRNKSEIVDAVTADFGSRSRHETMSAELLIVAGGIRYLLEHLEDWMKPQKRKVAVHFRPASAHIEFQPLGVVGVISPWNYPVQLALVPIATALAAGNRVMLKPSELTPNTSALLADIISSSFESDHVAVFQGGVKVGQAFSALPFDHLFYTGSTQVGRLVMKAAAENLTPVTLELGGKSPVIIHRDYPLDHAAERIVAGKFYNAGQTCVAPDYILVPEDKRDALVAKLKSTIATLYPTLASNPDYTSIINERHRKRLEGVIADAEAKGAKVVEVNPARESFENAGNKLAPRLILDATDDMTAMTDEIFGPLLPLVPYRDLDDAIDYVNDRPRPLALYYFDRDKRRTKKVLARTTSGNALVNDTILHVAVDDLPFGGVGPSGMGCYHGREGFETFSHKKGVLTQARFNATKLLNPPYGKRLDQLLGFLIGK